MDLDEDPFEIKCPSDQKLIEFVDLEVFETAIERALAGKFLYKWSMGNLFFYRGFLWQGMLHSFCIPNDFLTIKEYKYAAACGFEDYSYSDWKDITQLGYKTEKEFKTASGSYDAKEWKRIKLLGFNTHKKFDEATDMGFTGFMVDKKICMSFQTMEKKYNAAEKDYNFYDCFDYSIKALYHRLPGIKKENLDLNLYHVKLNTTPSSPS